MGGFGEGFKICRGKQGDMARHGREFTRLPHKINSVSAKVSHYRALLSLFQHNAHLCLDL